MKPAGMKTPEWLAVELTRHRDSIQLFQRICETTPAAQHLISPLYFITVMLDKLLVAEMEPEAITRPEFAEWYNPFEPLPPAKVEELRQEWLLKKYLTATHLARAHKLPVHRVRQCLIQQGVLKPRRKDRVLEKQDQILEMFSRGLSLSEIQRATGIAKQTVSSIVEEHGLPKDPSPDKELIQ